jgi:hypothetical protein
MKEIKLTQNQVALVDDEDFERLNQFKWCANKIGNTFYAISSINIDGIKKNVYMHRYIISGKHIDHIDGNGINNQKINLRICTHKENMMNQYKRSNLSSIFKGVSFYKPTKKWRCQININGKNTYLGCFISEIEAAKAYNKKAIENYGKFANLNVIP